VDSHVAQEATSEAKASRLLLWPLLGVMLAQLLAMLDMNVTATALPAIINQFGSLQSLAWVTAAYILAAIVTTPLYGKFGDLFGRKSVFTVAMVFFLTGSLLSGSAQSMAQLTAFRAVQGAGAGGFIVSAMVVYTELLTKEQRTRYQGLFSSTLTGFAALGPLIGGFVTDDFGWRWIFFMNVPIGVASLVLMLTTTHLKRQPRKVTIDLPGAILLGGAATCLVLVSSWAGNQYSWASAVIIGLLAGAVALLLAWLITERYASEPIVPLYLLRSRLLNIANLEAFISGATMFGALIFLPLFMQVSTSASPAISGLLLLPLTIGVMVAALVASPLMIKYGREKWFGFGGVALATTGTGLLLTLTPGTGEVVSIGYSVVIGLGLGLMVQVYALAVMNNAPMADLGAAVSLQTMGRQLGGALGLAIFSGIFQARLGSEVTSRTSATQRGLALAASHEPSKVRALPEALRNLVVTSYDHAIDTVFLTATGLLAVGLILALTIRLPSSRGQR
jgi:EmrB/QacA subfamily drug resistance transporter